MADITKPPKKPIRQINKPISVACTILNGVIQANKPAKMLALMTPPTKPSMVFDGERLGAILCLPHNFPQIYCNTSLACTTKIKKIINSIFFPSKPAISKVSTAGIWEIQNTEIIIAHCTLVERSKKWAASPCKADKIGKNRKAYTGIKMVNMLNQSIATKIY